MALSPPAFASPIQSLLKAVDRFREQVEPAYAQAGAESALQIHQPPGEHSFTMEAFEAMAAFFDEFLR